MQVGKNVLREVLGSDSTRYEIPLYQRTFDWSERQFEKLWEDVCDLALARQQRPNAEHFLGTLVLGRGHNVPNDFSFLVVDGQQRLTTLTMLLIAMRDVYRTQRSETSDADELEDGMLTHRYKKNIPDHYRLWPTQGDRPAFTKLMNGEPAADKTSNLVKAYDYFHAKLLDLAVADTEPSLGAPARIDDIKNSVLNGLRFVTIAADGGDNVYGIFESLNNTGLKLTQADLLRNFYFSRLGDLAEQTYSSFWFPMQERLSRDDLTHLFWLDLTENKKEAKKDDTFKLQSERAQPYDASKLRDELQRFNQKSILLEVMRQPAKESDPQVRRALQRLVDFGIESIDPLVIALLDKRLSGKITSAQTAEALAVIESFLVRRLVVRAPHNALSRILMRASSTLDWSKPAHSLREYFTKDNKDFASDDRIRQAVTSSNFYRSGTVRQRKTLLSWFEAELAGNEPAQLQKATIEHIMPQTISEAWRASLIEDLGAFNSADAVHEALVHTLANLTLSGYNSKLSNHTFERKRELLVQKSNIELNKEIAKNQVWRRSELLERGKQLADLIAQTWVGPISQNEQAPETLSVSRVSTMVGNIPAGRWSSYGAVGDALESTAADVKEVLVRTPSIPFAWRVMDAGGRHVDPVAPDSSANEYSKRIKDEGVQFDTTGKAMREHQWNFPDTSELSNRRDDSPQELEGPLREFLDHSTNRLTPAMSSALRDAMIDWSGRGGRLLIGVGPDEDGTLTAVLEESEVAGEPIIELHLSSAGGLSVKRQGDLVTSGILDVDEMSSVRSFGTDILRGQD